MLSAFPSRFIAGLIALGASSGLSAQTGGFLQRQQPQGVPGQEQDGVPSSARPAYCAEPANASLMECGSFPAPRVSTGQSGGAARASFPGLADPTAGMRPAPESRDGTNPGATLTPEIGTVAEAPTEFQRYVQEATGQMLPIFGASLFERVPSTFAPVDRIPVAPNYVIGPGDELELRVWGQINSNQQLIVDRSGAVYLPEVGPVTVAGLTFAQLESTLRSSIGRVYRNFDLNVNLGQLRSIQIFVVGQARRPGSYTVSSLSTLVNVLFASGGPSSRGSLRHIQLKRGGAIVSELDLYDLLLNGDKSKDVTVLPGDILFVPAVGPQVAVTGSVGYPAIYELKEASSLSEILTFAGGLSPLASAQHAAIERIDDHSVLKTSDVSLDDAGLSATVQNGDIVRILDVVARFDNAVTLRGNVANASRMPWRPGMKVSDLIPDTEVLLTRDYWRERNSLGTAVAPARDAGAAEIASLGITALPQTLRPPSLQREQTVGASNDRSLGAAQEQAVGLTVRKFDVRNQVKPPAPDVNWDYAVVERLDSSTLATKLIPFNLRRAVIDHDPSQDLPLESGDVVTILSKADVSVPLEQTTKYVRVEGEVGSAGVYSVRSGETLRSLLARAGGITADAYLYGLQFTRESTQREQQQRFNEFLDTLETQIDESASNLTGRVLSANDAAVSQSAVAGQRALLQKLRDTPPAGRIVLELNPAAASLEDLPDLPLEDGDRIHIPNRPHTLNVIGTVANQASFVYRQDYRFGDYLRQAGGPTRLADQSHMFVIRADGSVVSKPPSASVFGRRIDSLRMFPGDTLVVPTYVNKLTFLRGLTDWSQVIGSFGLGAAAINVLR
jgi:protein involved in polysaccharide export with SLBB domain